MSLMIIKKSSFLWKLIILVCFNLVFISCRTTSITDYIHEATYDLKIVKKNISLEKLSLYKIENILCKPWISHNDYTSQNVSIYCYAEHLPQSQIIIESADLLLSGSVAYRMSKEKSVIMRFDENKKLFSGHIKLFDKIENVKLEQAKTIELKINIRVGGNEKAIQYVITPSIRTYFIQR